MLFLSPYLLLMPLQHHARAPRPVPLPVATSPDSFDAQTVCSQTATFAFKAKMHEIQDDYNITLGVCANVTNPALQAACLAAAQEELQAGQLLAVAQLQARNQLCALLGGGAYDPVIAPSNFVSGITNPLFPLKPRTTYTYRSVTSEGTEIDVVEVTQNTLEISGVQCTAVHDVSTIDGELSEDTLDYYAQDKQGNVWYFGEDTTQYEEGVVVGVEGSFKAGENGAKPGIIMKAAPAVGDTYRQEFALGDAEDAATVLELHASATVPFGTFGNCLHTEDFSPIEPGVLEQKFYAPTIGDVLEIDGDGNRLELLTVKHL